ncbi:MAG: tetratricopeptide repeat protein [Opitutus sp.]|nr:tetratricopeptide repeat protein [Opitutus sp.]
MIGVARTMPLTRGGNPRRWKAPPIMRGIFAVMRHLPFSTLPWLKARASSLCGVAAGVLIYLALPTRLPAHGAYHERLRELVAAIEINPKDARLHFELAEIFCRHGDWALAVASADTADELSSGAFPTDLLRGEALLSGGKPGPARTMLDRFLARNPTNTRALLLRARARAATDGDAAALADYRAAVRADVRSELDYTREAAAALATHGCVGEALEAIDRAIVQIGPDPALLAQAFELEAANGRFEAALARVALLQAGAPRPEPWMIRRAQLLAQAGRSAEARRAWIAFLEHADGLPNLERGSRAMTAYVAQARAGQAALPP